MQSAQVGLTLGPAVGGFVLAASPAALWLGACCLSLRIPRLALMLERHLPQSALRTPAPDASPPWQHDESTNLRQQHPVPQMELRLDEPPASTRTRSSSGAPARTASTASRRCGVGRANTGSRFPPRRRRPRRLASAVQAPLRRGWAIGVDNRE